MTGFRTWRLCVLAGDKSESDNQKPKGDTPMRTLDLLASDSSHLPFLYVFKESKVMEK